MRQGTGLPVPCSFLVVSLIVRRFVACCLGHSRSCGRRASVLVQAAGLAQDRSRIWTAAATRTGRTHVTNLREDTSGKNCRIVQQTRVQVVPRAERDRRRRLPRERRRAASRRRTRRRAPRRASASARSSRASSSARKPRSPSARRSSTSRSRSATATSATTPSARAAAEVQGRGGAAQKNVEALKRELSNLRSVIRAAVSAAGRRPRRGLECLRPARTMVVLDEPTAVVPATPIRPLENLLRASAARQPDRPGVRADCSRTTRR